MEKDSWKINIRILLPPGEELKAQEIFHDLTWYMDNPSVFKRPTLKI